MTAKFTVEELYAYYGDFEALSGISMQIEDREITGLIGPSGCGKSTFLRCLNRMNDTIPGSRVEGRIASPLGHHTLLSLASASISAPTSSSN